jgi:hypothetical protein
MLHQLLGKSLVGFEPGSGRTRSEDLQAGVLELVDQTEHEGVLGTDDRQVDLRIAGELEESRDVRVPDVDVPGERGGAGVARRDVQFPYVP